MLSTHTSDQVWEFIASAACLADWVASLLVHLLPLGPTLLEIPLHQLRYPATPSGRRLFAAHLQRSHRAGYAGRALDCAEFIVRGVAIPEFAGELL